MPQFDVTFYFSQIFWLVLCLIALVIAFRNFFIPRMNNRLARRDEYIDKCLRGAEILELEIQEIESKIAQIRKNEAEKSSEIIRNAIRTSDEIMSNQISAIQKENEALINGTRFRLNEEIKGVESTFKIHVEETAKCVFHKIFTQGGKRDNQDAV